MNDRVLQVDGRSLRGLENIEAAAVLRNSGNPVRLVFGRPKPKGRVPNREREKLNSSTYIIVLKYFICKLHNEVYNITICIIKYIQHTYSLSEV